MAVVGGVGSRENINFIKKNDYKSSNSFIQQKNQQFTGTFSYKNDYEAIDYSKNVSDYSNQKERSFIDEGFQTGVTLALSTASGVLSVGEDIVDGAVIVAGGLVSKLVGLIDSDTGKALESDVSEFVKKEYTEGLYSTTVDAIGLDEDIAYGKAHTVGQIAGNVAGYAAITVLTGGVATVAVSSLAAVGNASEAALNSGATFNQTLVVGAVSGVAGALSGGALDKIGKMAGEKILLQKVINPATVGKYIASGSLVSMSEPVINKTAEYFTYGKNMSDGYFNYFKETGGIVSTLMAGAVGTLSIAGNTYKSYSTLKTSQDNVFSENLIHKIANYNKSVEEAKEEISKIGPNLVKLYEEGKTTGNLIKNFLGYEEHNFLHVSRVANRSKRIANLLNNNISLLEGCQIIDEDIVYKAGLVHDLGMRRGGYVLFDDGFLAKIDDVVANFENYSEMTYNGGKKISKSTIKKIEGDLIRSQHPLNSAISVLENRELFGDDTDLIAVLALAHSKSTSGVRQLASVEQLTDMINKLYISSKATGIKFNISNLADLNANGSFAFKDDVLGKIRTGSIALREGDAHALKTGFNHGGKPIIVESVENIDKSLYEMETLEKLCELEANKSTIKVGNTELINDKDLEFSKRIILGEKNSHVLPEENVIDGRLVYTHEVKSSAAPACTWLYGIKEKFGEYKTFDGIKQKVIIKLPEDMPKVTREFYEIQATNNSSDWLEIEIQTG